MPSKNTAAHNAAQARYRKTEKGKACAKRSKKTKSGRLTQQRYISRWRERNKVKNSAHGKVSYALKIGKIVRGACEYCGESEVIAHHDDYTKPLNVRWLCQKHHNKVHSIPRYKEVTVRTKRP